MPEAILAESGGALPIHRLIDELIRRSGHLAGRLALVDAVKDGRVVVNHGIIALKNRGAK